MRLLRSENVVFTPQQPHFLLNLMTLPLRVALFLVDLKGFPPQGGDKLRLPQAHGKMKTALSDGFHFGGPEGIRTLDLSDANRTLYRIVRF